MHTFWLSGHLSPPPTAPLDCSLLEDTAWAAELAPGYPPLCIRTLRSVALQALPTRGRVSVPLLERRLAVRWPSALNVAEGTVLNLGLISLSWNHRTSAGELKEEARVGHGPPH